MGSVTLSDPSLFREQCYIDGQWCDADDGGTFTVDNPATEETLGTAPRMGEAETRRAIDAAHAAFPDLLEYDVTPRDGLSNERIGI